jgi:uncharacterized protein (DUF697 family)
MSDEANKRVKRVIWQTTIASGALGVLLSPIPLADELLLVPIYGVMTVRIAGARGVSVLKVPWRPIGGAILAGLAARAAANVSFALIPGVAAVANMVSAVALTKLIGDYADKTCRGDTAEAPPAPAAAETPITEPASAFA